MHILLLSRRYYRIYGSNLSASRLNKHITKLKKTTKRHWADLPNQVAQDVVLRYGKSQDAFSQKIKSRHKYSSLTFTEAGYTLEDNHIKINCIDTFRLWVP